MKVLSLYDGMACGMIAMQLAEMDIESYDAYEIDKYAIKTAKHNFPIIKEHGDVFETDFTQYQCVDFLIGGSPCTYWSIAQTKNRETVASGMGWKLFSQYVRALHESKPKYFIYENNKSMSKDIRASIDKAFGFEAVCINSALVSAQNRQRLYWVGRRNTDGTYSQVPVEQPEDRGILLRDILETGAVTWKEKAYTLRASAGTKQGVSNILRHIETNGKFGYIGVAVPVRIGEIENAATGTGYDTSKQYKVYSPDAKATALCGNGGGLGAKTGLYATPVAAADGKRMPVYAVRDGFITIKGERYPIKLRDGFYIIRKLTVRECMRLQTVPEEYVFPVSNSQAYKMLGNGWTCEVIAHILKYLKEA